MGYSPGEFVDDYTQRTLHWEASFGRIYLWNHNESEVVLSLTIDQARKANNDLALLVQMNEDNSS